jgi:hypothetical protein
MKVVDDSLNQRATMQIEDETRKLMAGNPPQLIINSFALVTFFSSQKAHLPSLHKVGDIIRVQRCHCKAYRG